MGEELIETLEVYLGSKQNIRETARRLHLAPRTVAYRLERIETLLGVRLDGEIDDAPGRGPHRAARHPRDRRDGARSDR